MLTSFPPLIAMRAELGDQLVRETYLRWVDDVNDADDGRVRYRGDYRARKRADELGFEGHIAWSAAMRDLPTSRLT